MASRLAISVLERKHAELAVKMKAVEGRIERIKEEAKLLKPLAAEVREMADELVRLEVSIRLLDENWTPSPPFGRSRRPAVRR